MVGLRMPHDRRWSPTSDPVRATLSNGDAARRCLPKAPRRCVLVGGLGSRSVILSWSGRDQFGHLPGDLPCGSPGVGGEDLASVA
jgi:hypothetical protein